MTIGQGGAVVKGALAAATSVHPKANLWVLFVERVQVERENPGWDSGQYLKFERERTLPCRDLVARIELKSPHLIVDLGCGPGNSTAVLAERWPQAKVTGVDSSAEMLKAARSSSVNAEWLLADIRDWKPARPVDLLFSNAALQWVPGQESEVPRLIGLVSPGGAFAFQIPAGAGEWTKALREVAESREWRDRLEEKVLDLHTHELDFYYGLLAPRSISVDLWETCYIHVLPSAEAVVEWTQGTALRPVLQRLSAEERLRFLGDYTSAIRRAYPPQRDGRVLFPFLRRFVVAYR